jgi:hypothetical protein
MCPVRSVTYVSGRSLFFKIYRDLYRCSHEIFRKEKLGLSAVTRRHQIPNCQPVNAAALKTDKSARGYDRYNFSIALPIVEVWQAASPR